MDIVSGVARVAPFKYAEEATVIEVRILGVQASGDVHPKAGLRRVSIKLQFNRNPVIGDKFSSRHGQKVMPTPLSYLLIPSHSNLLLRVLCPSFTRKITCPTLRMA